MKYITSLDVSKTGITNQAIKLISESKAFNNLTHLYLRGNPEVSDRVLRVINSSKVLENLKEVFTKDSGITIIGIKNIKNSKVKYNYLWVLSS